MKVSGFSKEYTCFTEDSANEYLEENHKDIMDLWYYEVRDKIIHTSHKSLVTFDDESTDTRVFETFISRYKTETVDLLEGKPKYFDGPKYKYTLEIDGEKYTVVEARSPYKWFYCDIYLIMEFSRMTDTPIEFSDPIPFCVC